MCTTVHCIITMWHVATAMPDATHDCGDELACCLYTVKACLAMCQEMLHWGEGDVISFCMANVCKQCCELAEQGCYHVNRALADMNRAEHTVKI